LAAITNAPLSFERKELTRQVNQVGTRNVVAQALKSSVKRVIYASTASVYGPTRGVVTEKSKCKPESPYGKYKLMGEKQCLDAHERHGLDTVVLRFATVYGYSPGWRVQGIVVNRLTYLACTGNPITVYGTGNQKRPFIDLRDVVKALVFAFDRPGVEGEVYNVVGQNASVNEVVDTILRFLPDSKVVKLRGSKHLEELSYMLDDSKIRGIGFLTSHTIEDGVRQIIEMFLGSEHVRRRGGGND
jgi:nucleoside-diphosphate-sugar epimerase